MLWGEWDEKINKINNKCKRSERIVEGMGGEGDLLWMEEEIKSWPYNQMVEKPESVQEDKWFVI